MEKLNIFVFYLQIKGQKRCHKLKPVNVVFPSPFGIIMSSSTKYNQIRILFYNLQYNIYLYYDVLQGERERSCIYVLQGEREDHVFMCFKERGRIMYLCASRGEGAIMYLCASRREGGSCIFVLQYINT
jgi:hypothetical protein